MKKVCVMARSREQAARQRPNAAILRHCVEHEYAGACPDIVQNEIPWLLETPESLLKEAEHDG